MTDIIDRKFRILAVNPAKGTVYTEKNAVLLCAKDKAIIPALQAYRDECMKLNCHGGHIKSINLLIERVRNYQQLVQSRIPDTDHPVEIERCIGGKGLED
jgi:hypothetical protein